MEILHLTIQGRIPSKKNSTINIRHTRLPSNKARQWMRDAGVQIMAFKGKKLKNVDIQFEFWMPDNRKTDLDNKVTSVLDLLKDMEVIADDSWQNVPSFYARCRGIAKENPRVEIWIKEII